MRRFSRYLDTVVCDTVLNWVWQCQINWWFRLLDRQELLLWHSESPGMKVRVIRTRFGRWFKSRDFATLSETCRSYLRHRPKLCPPLPV